MKPIKALLCLALAALFCLPPTRTARASSDGRNYARADNRYTYFCAEKNLERALFAVPYTYCVEILAEDGDWYYVRYAQDTGMYRALTGFCLKEGLTRVNEPPENIYLDYPVTVTYRAGDEGNSLPTLGEITVTAAFYGVYYKGASAYSYVLYDGFFGYIAGANDNYPLNEIPEENTDPPIVDGGGNAKVITALIITALAASAIVILFLTGKKKPTYGGK